MTFFTKENPVRLFFLGGYSSLCVGILLFLVYDQVARINNDPDLLGYEGFPVLILFTFISLSLFAAGISYWFLDRRDSKAQIIRLRLD